VSDDELETKDGEVLPNREVMSVISTDPSDVILPPEEMSIQPYEEEPLEPRHTLPVDEPPAA
jgi:hypothetical protein